MLTNSRFCSIADNLLEAQAIITDNAGSPKPPTLKGPGWQRDRWSLLSFEAILKSRTKNELSIINVFLFQIFEHLFISIYFHAQLFIVVSTDLPMCGTGDHCRPHTDISGDEFVKASTGP